MVSNKVSINLQVLGGSKRHKQTSWSMPIKFLDVSSDADGKTVKRAYRKLMNEHHPDKLMAKGLPPEMMNVAKEKSQEIQNAYDLIKKVKGFK